MSNVSLHWLHWNLLYRSQLKQYCNSSRHKQNNYKQCNHTAAFRGTSLDKIPIWHSNEKCSFEESESSFTFHPRAVASRWLLSARNFRKKSQNGVEFFHLEYTIWPQTASLAQTSRSFTRQTLYNSQSETSLKFSVILTILSDCLYIISVNISNFYCNLLRLTTNAQQLVQFFSSQLFKNSC